MTTNFTATPTASAKIYTFPPRGRFALRIDDTAPAANVLMCDICVPRRALPQIAAESKASAPPPAGFQAFCVPIGA